MGGGGMGGPPPAEAPPATGAEQASIFLSAESLGGRKVKKGDTLTLTVSDVDPETGDVQADLAGGGSETNETNGPMADFDEAVPEEGEV